MTGNVVHPTPDGRYVIARRLADGRYVVPVHAALWSIFGHVRIGLFDEVYMLGYAYLSLAKARDRARSHYPFA